MNMVQKILSRVLVVLMVVLSVFTTDLLQVKAEDLTQVIYDVSYGTEADGKLVQESSNLVRTGSAVAFTYDTGLQNKANTRAAELALYYSTTNHPNGTTVDDQNAELVAIDVTNALAAYAQWKATLDTTTTYTHIGVGHAICNNRHYWVAELGTTPDSSSAPASQVTQNLLNSYITSKNVVLSKKTTEIKVGDTEALPTVTASICTNDGKHNTEATAVPLAAAVTTYEWSDSNDSTIAKVDQTNQTVTGVKAGNTSVSVKALLSGTIFEIASYTINVSTESKAVTSVSLNTSTLNLSVKDTATLQATVAPSDATNKKVTWSSSDTTIATVSDQGVVTGVKIGTATITVTTEDGAKTATCKVTVKEASKIVSSVSLNKNTMSLAIGNSETLTATILPSTADNKNTSWTSSDKSVAIVNGGANLGVVTALKLGTTTITVTTEDGAKTATCVVTVVPVKNVQSVTLNQTSAELYVNETVTLTPTINPSDATNKKVTWKSSDATVAQVSDTGVVTAKKAGTATITVTTSDGSKIATCTVTVSERPVADTPTQPTVTANIDIANAQISNVKNKYVYSGAEIEPVPIVTYMGTELVNGRDYNIYYINNSSIGTASIYITGIGSYTGNNTRTFKIIPVATTLKTMQAGKGTLKVKWNAQSQGVNGYQIQYSLKQGMSSAKVKNVLGKNKQSVTLKGLKNKKKYYVRIRVYGTVSGEKYYSAWSSVKSKKTK